MTLMVSFTTSFAMSLTMSITVRVIAVAAFTRVGRHIRFGHERLRRLVCDMSLAGHEDQTP